MNSPIDKALSRSRALYTTAIDRAAALEKQGTLGSVADISGSEGLAQIGQFRDQAANRQRYSLFRGWVYAAINAIAMEAAGQPVNVGVMKGVSSRSSDRSHPNRVKDYQRRKMTSGARAKAAEEELEILPDHPLREALERPNGIQDRWQFVYSFVANLCLTGWAFIVGGKSQDGEGVEFFVLPTTWVNPNKDFSKFKITNPKKPGDQGQELDASQVAFAYLPNPSDPTGALAPAAAQMHAIKIDDNIQYSQRVFFENGIFPSVIITIGKNPHPDATMGKDGRPRLTAKQRRQVYSAVRKVSGGVANYGNPAIVDGLIEKIERLSATQTEMGWEKSENKVRTRILSVFGVHPFILGEDMAGSYAQAYNVERRFCKRVNTFLDLLGNVLSNFSVNFVEEESDKTVIWWDECEAVDPSLEQKKWSEARKNQDITQNEFRSFMGLPPDEDRNEAVINRQSLAAVSKIASDTTKGTITPEQAKAILVGMGLPDDLAEEIAGEGAPEPPAQPQPPPPQLQSGQQPPSDQPGQGQQNQQGEQQQLQRAVNTLESAVNALTITPKEVADFIIDRSKKN